MNSKSQCYLRKTATRLNLAPASLKSIGYWAGANSALQRAELSMEGKTRTVSFDKTPWVELGV